MHSLRLAIQLLTILPVGGPAPRPELVGRSLAWYPLVGAGIGLVGSLLALGTRGVGMPAVVSAALALVAMVVVTGGLHLDGLMDTCDGVVSHRTPEERLAIMRDPRVGSYGVIGGACVLLLKFAALSTIPSERLLGSLVTATALGRAVMVGAAVLAPPGRPAGLGTRMTAGAGRRELVLAMLTALAVALLSAGAVGALLALTAAGVGLLLGRWLLARLPGLTGDTFGALNEAVEATVLVLAAW